MFSGFHYPTRLVAMGEAVSGKAKLAVSNLFIYLNYFTILQNEVNAIFQHLAVNICSIQIN